MNAFYLAAIPLLDWSGPEFLAFYVTALVTIGIWCRFRVIESVKAFDHPGADAEPRAQELDPFEIAFLSAGAPRMVQLVITRLIHAGILEWRKEPKSNSTPHLVAQLTPRAARHAALHPVEETLLAKVLAAGSKGLPVREAAQGITGEVRAIEVALAAMGLRPTSEERSRAAMNCLLPLGLLLIAGIAKLFIGISRDKPVIFLAGLLLVTVLVLFALPSSAPRLTDSGKRLLDALRGENELTRSSKSRPTQLGENLPLLSSSVALFGPMILAPLPLYAAIHQDLDRIHKRSATNGSTGCSSGCTPGCGGGGDGGGGGCGSGCGGCGGGGD